MLRDEMVTPRFHYVNSSEDCELVGGEYRPQVIVGSFVKCIFPKQQACRGELRQCLLPMKSTYRDSIDLH